MSKKIRLVVLSVQDEVIEAYRIANKRLSASDLELILGEVRENGKFPFKAALLTALRSPLNPQVGLSIQEIEESYEVIQLIKRVPDGGILEMDDDKFKYMEKKLESFKTGGYDDRWIQLNHTVRNATKDLLDETPEEASGGNGE